MDFVTPEIVISCIAIGISFIMGVGGFLATLLCALFGFLIKRMITTIEDKINTLASKFETMVTNKEVAHTNIRQEIRDTETKMDVKVSDIKTDVSSINKAIGRLEGAFKSNLIMSRDETHRG